MVFDITRLGLDGSRMGILIPLVLSDQVWCDI